MTQVTITIHAETPDEIARIGAALAVLGGEAKLATGGKAPAAKPGTKASTPATSSGSITQEAGPTATNDASPSEGATEQTDEAGVDIGAVKLAATSYSAKNGRDALAALIKDHGGTAGISSIPEQNWAAFVAQAEG